MKEMLIFGRYMLLIGAALLSVVFAISMSYAKGMPTVQWVQAMLSLIFSFQALTAAVAILSNATAEPVMVLFVVVNGTVKIAVAVIFTGILWSHTRQSKQQLR